MVALKELVDYTNKLLDVTSFGDYCPNGLQVEGDGQVQVLVSGVTASMALIEAAAAAGADALLVHHGWFWKSESPCVTGMKRQRLQALLDAGISLLAYHLPLDAHARFGNNTQLARVLGLETEGRFGDDGGMQLAHYGRLSRPLDAAAFCEYLESSLGRSPQHIAGSTPSIERVGWCSGAAQSYLEAAADQGLDAFISGEISEQTVHVARERGIHYFAAGHHATERFGACALGEHLAGHFALQHHFIDIDNPV
ncbi:MAG: Nif3-like dinuclear metal center hexameric protein [Gammaproteobacteria bacterium]